MLNGSWDDEVVSLKLAVLRREIQWIMVLLLMWSENETPPQGIPYWPSYRALEKGHPVLGCRLGTPKNDGQGAKSRMSSELLHNLSTWSTWHTSFHHPGSGFVPQYAQQTYLNIRLIVIITVIVKNTPAHAHDSCSSCYNIFLLTMCISWHLTFGLRIGPLR